MSLDAIRWAWAQEVKTGAQRLVLLAFADLARRGGALVFASRERLKLMTLLDAKTIRAAIISLVRLGMIVPTGDHRGRSGRIPVYRINFGDGAENGRINPAGNTTENGRIDPEVNETQNGTIEPVGLPPEMGPNSPPNETESPSQCDRFRSDLMVPKTDARTRKEVEPGYEPGKEEPFRAATAAFASAPLKPQEHEQSENPEDQGAQQKRNRDLDAWAAEHGLIQQRGEPRSAFRTRVLFAKATIEAKKAEAA